jgi:hypothetical protein
MNLKTGGIRGGPSIAVASSNVSPRLDTPQEPLALGLIADRAGQCRRASGARQCHAVEHALGPIAQLPDDDEPVGARPHVLEDHMPGVVLRRGGVGSPG